MSTNVDARMADEHEQQWAKQMDEIDLFASLGLSAEAVSELNVRANVLTSLRNTISYEMLTDHVKDSVCSDLLRYSK